MLALKNKFHFSDNLYSCNIFFCEDHSELTLLVVLPHGPHEIQPKEAMASVSAKEKLEQLKKQGDSHDPPSFKPG